MDAPYHRLRALGDAHRLLLARVLVEGSFNVGELQAVLGLGQSTVSRNLRLLSEAGLVEPHRHGRAVYYAWRHDAGAAVDGLRAWVRRHSPVLTAEQRLRVADVWNQRKERSATFFRGVDPSDATQAWLGSPDAVDALLDALPEDRVVVDLGAGSGRLLPALSSRSKAVVAVDDSPTMLERAREVLSARGIDNVDLRRGDLDALPLDAGTADVAVAHMVLHHLPEPARLFPSLWRVLRPGGTVLLADFLPHDQEWMREAMADQWLGFEPQHVERWLRDAGFHDVQLNRLDAQRPEALGVFLARATRPPGPPATQE